jgi:tetratricopeptide (TPR) repeat protein
VTPTLQIAQGEGRHIDICFTSSPSDRRVASSHLDFSLGLKEQDSLRWYWEDFLEHPNRNTRRLATEVEGQLQKLGERLFQRVFRDSETQQIWSEVAPRLAETRIEIAVSGDSSASTIPWELMRDPLTGVVLSTKAAAFARRLGVANDFTAANDFAAPTAGTPPAGAPPNGENQASEGPSAGPLRILMVICQPPGPADPPFRSAARLLVTSLASQPRTSLILDVLRPPTFGQLTSVLLEAEALGEPYHVLHFDGHAIIADIERDGVPAELPQGAGRLPLTQTLAGLHGYLVFDYPTREQTVQLVDGASMGELLAESRVPLLLLNACQPSRTKEAAVSEGVNVRRTTAFAFDSLTRDVLAQGVNAVVQFPYHLGPVGSSRWIEQIYLALAQGVPVSEAATAGRRRLQEEARLQISYGPVRREDWPAAVVHESRALALVRKAPTDPGPAEEPEKPSPNPETNVSLARSLGDDLLDPALPPRPAVGFLGRDDTILALERALAAKPVALLHGEEGAGKSTTAAEFARWYAATAGVEGPVLYTSFEHYRPLRAVLDQLGAVFQRSMEAAGYRWRAMSCQERRQAVLHVLNQIPVLWIWDSVDAISGSAGDSSPEWTADDRQDLAEFLRQAAESQAKFLLTSRSTEEQWLGSIAVTVQLGPLPLWEALQLTRALVEQRGCWPPEIDSWRPLLDFAAGNPLAVHGLVTESLRNGLRSAQQIEKLVLQVCDLSPGPRASAGQPPPAHLAASLNYVLGNAFSDEERPMLALLHLFRGAVDVGLLESMGAQREVWTAKESHAARHLRPFPNMPPAAVLDRAASYGLLRRVGEGAYSIHPAMDRASVQLFSECFPVAKKSGVWNQMADRAAAVAAGARTYSGEDAKAEAAAPRGPAGAVVGALAGLGEHGSLTPFGLQAPPEMGPNQRAMFSYVRALSRFGAERFRPAREGVPQAVAELSAQEPNLRHACRLAGDQQWWDPAAGIVEGLGALYEADGRLGEWEELVDGLRTLCAGQGNQAKPGRERLWRTITEQGVKISRHRDHLPRAEELQRLCVDWDRRQAEPALEVVRVEPNPVEAVKVRTLAESLFGLSEILRAEGTPAIKVEEEAIELRERLGEKRQASMWAFELGAAYTETPAVRNLAQAERWLKRSLELIHDDDSAAKAECLAALGRVAWERFNEARKGNAPEAELRRHLSTARQYYQLALERDLPDDWGKLASHNQQLGHVSYSLGDIDRALPHYRESIRCDELHGNTFGAAQTRFNVAIALRDVDRLGEARKFARAAQQDLQALGSPGAPMLERCDKLIANIEERLKVKRRERGVLNGG